MKKTTFILITVLTLSTLLTVTTKAAILSVETSASCLAGTDNDGDLLTGVTDPDCDTTVFVYTTTIETAASCAAGTDNDGDFLTGLADSDCTAFNTITISTSSVETAASCAAGTDNDGDFLTGLADSDCVAFAPVATTTTPVPPVSGGGGSSGPSFGGGSSFGGSSFGGITSGTPVSNVITSTSTCNVMKTFIKKGRNNDAVEVRRLQSFLNGNLGLNIPTTGFFGNMTFDAVKTFQLKYKTNVLAPWGITAPTGYFYKTTQRQMNLLLCPATEFPMPSLN